MYLHYSVAVLIYFIAAASRARLADVDLNRIKFVAGSESKLITAIKNTHNRRSINHSANTVRNVYDNNSSGFLHSQTQRAYVHEQSLPVGPRSTLKVYQPKEDPRFFYQSDTYLKEVLGGQVTPEVSQVYPGRDVVLANIENDSHATSMSLIGHERSQQILDSTQNLCIKCPAERTLIAKLGADRVLFGKPKLTTCSNRKTPKGVYFVRMFGPPFGSLLETGTHIMVGKVVYEGQVLQLCKMQVHVVSQTCMTPDYLNVACDRKKICNFTCRDQRLELYGTASLVCGDDLQWKGTLPTCRERSWCDYPQPPEHGRLSCVGAGDGGRLAEGARCKALCGRGWRWSPRVPTVCTRGKWTTQLSCSPRHVRKST